MTADGWIWAAVALGGALGACLRHGVALIALHAMGPAWPWGTLVANLAGSFFLAWLTGRQLAGADHAAQTMRFWTTGFAGAFTTYSTFNLELLTLLRNRGPGPAGGYGLVTLVGALAAGYLGLRVSGALDLTS